MSSETPPAAPHWPATLLGHLLPVEAPQLRPPDPEADLSCWAASGLMALTGRMDGPALAPPPALVPGLRWAGAALSAWLGSHDDALQLLGERAAFAGLSRRGTKSCGGATRLCAAADGTLAVCLARPSDIDSVPALLEQQVMGEHSWEALVRQLPGRPCAHWVERARLLGMPVSELGATPVPTPQAPAVQATAIHDVQLPPCESVAGVTVVDLSALWAGPLCAQLLRAAGATVVKVESTDRPDAARLGPPGFYRLLHAGQPSVTVELASPAGRAELAALLSGADVVIEASRPRALEHLGMGPHDFLGHGRMRAWVSITGFGRTGPGRDRPAFGDDAAVAGGLVSWEDGEPRFCADAVADPLTGITAALATICALKKGDAWLLDVAMSRVAAAFAGPCSMHPDPLPTGLVAAAAKHRIP